MKGIVGQTKSDTRRHYYVTPWGYPIRLCTWTMAEEELESETYKPMCKTCKGIINGKRKGPYCSIKVLEGD